MKFEEFSHIIISVVTVSIAFAIAWTGLTEFTPEFASVFVLILVTVGSGFIFHELAHKYVAIRYGAYAEYRSWTLGLVLAIGMAILFGFVFAAPGAVYIYGRNLTKEQNGRIAIAGPATNAVLAIGFIALAFFEPSLAGLAKTGASVNAFLGLFNLIPIFPLDGSKVLAWSRGAWMTAVAVLGGVMFLAPSALG
jgi:Zn-dependent protease